MAQQEIVELRYQLFCDWHKFMAAYYSSSGDLKAFRDQSSNLGDFIQKSLQPVNEKIKRAGTLVVGKQTVTANASPKVSLTIPTNSLEPKNPANADLAVQVILRLKALIDTLRETKLIDQFEITNLPAEHFWRPREPVILLSGPVAVSTQRHGEDGDLTCAVLEVPDAPGTEAFINAVGALKPSNPLDPGIQTQKNSPWHPIILEWSVSVHPVGTGRVANPQIANTLDYASNFVSGSFKLQQNEPDFASPNGLSLLDRNTYEGRCLMTPTASTQLDTNLRGFLIKTTLDDCRDRAASGETGYIDRLITWYQTKHKIKPPQTDAEKRRWLKLRMPFIDPEKKDPGGNPLLLPVAELLTFYAGKPMAGAGRIVSNLTTGQQAQDPVYSAIRALSKLDGKLVLSQALGGFNAALMTRRQVLQIPIEDPMESTSLVPPRVTAEVAQAVGRRHPTAPRAGKVFSPIRSGALTFESLRLLDTFGQKWDSPLTGLVTSNSLFDPNEKNSSITYLPPRFSTPARLNFRWLAAISGKDRVDEVEMNSVPATTPVCGWLLPNNFDNSLMVYDNTGRALGSINTLAEWAPAPGSEDRIAAAEIPNAHLRRLVRRLVIDAGTPPEQNTIRRHFVESLLSTVDSAVEAIEPASFAQHEALALLMGRPVAVVRARVDLQVMGQPTDCESIDDPTIPGGKAFRIQKSGSWRAFADQDWEVLAYDWGQYYGCTHDQVKDESCSFMGSPPPNYSRTTHEFEKVVIPMRLGEHQLLNDGLVGFWKEKPDGELDNVFHAPQTLDDLKIDDDVKYTESLTTPCIRAYTAGVTDNLSVTLQDDPLALTILMDPRGVIHVTTGILPVNNLEIPSAYYADAIQHMGVTFRISPILTDAEQLHSALPKESGYVWSWVTRPNGSTWEETSAIADATEHAHFFKPPKIVEGWLKLTPKKEGSENIP